MIKLLAWGAVAGIGIYAYRKKVELDACKAACDLGEVIDPRGFVVTDDCQKFIVTDPMRFKSTISEFYRDQKLNQMPGEANFEVADVPYAMMVNFFRTYAPNCEVTSPTAPISRKLMAVFVQLAFTAEAVSDGLLSAVEQSGIRDQLLDSISLVTDQDWSRVFDDTVVKPKSSDDSQTGA